MAESLNNQNIADLLLPHSEQRPGKTKWKIMIPTLPYRTLGPRRPERLEPGIDLVHRRVVPDPPGDLPRALERASSLLRFVRFLRHDAEVEPDKPLLEPCSQPGITGRGQLELRDRRHGLPHARQ